MKKLSLTPLSSRPAPEMSQSRDRSSVNTLTILVMVSNLSQKLSSLLKSSLLARLPLLRLMLLPPLHKVVDKVL